MGVGDDREHGPEHGRGVDRHAGTGVRVRPGRRPGARRGDRDRAPSGRPVVGGKGEVAGEEHPAVAERQHRQAARDGAPVHHRHGPDRVRPAWRRRRRHHLRGREALGLPVGTRPVDPAGRRQSHRRRVPALPRGERAQGVRSDVPGPGRYRAHDNLGEQSRRGSHLPQRGLESASRARRPGPAWATAGSKRSIRRTARPSSGHGRPRTSAAPTRRPSTGCDARTASTAGSWIRRRRGSGRAANFSATSARRSTSTTGARPRKRSRRASARRS